VSTTVLSQYPFSNEFRGKLETTLGQAPTYMLVSELRSLSPSEIWKRLRRIESRRIVIPLEDDGAKATLPFLKLLAGMTPARTIEVVSSDFRETPSSRWSLAGDLSSVTAASARGRFAASTAAREIKSLLRSERIPTSLGTSKSVLYINANLWFGVKAGGSVGHIAGVVNALNQLGYAVNYASASGNAMIEDGVECLRLQPPTSFGFPLEYNHYRFNNTATAQILASSGHSYRFIYQRMSLANFTGVRYSRKYGIPLVLEYNGSEAWIAKNWGRPLKNHMLAVASEDVSLKHAHVVVTISDALKEELMERGVEGARIACYPNCIDESLFDPAKCGTAEIQAIRAAHRIPNDAVVIGFIGTFGPWHGIEILARAIAQLGINSEEWLKRTKVRFMLVGDGNKMSDVKQILSGSVGMKYTTLTGLVPQHQAPVYLASTDVLASPHVANADGSRFFGSPTKLFEYMAMGKAIVASDLDQIGEVLKNSLRTGSLPEDESNGTETAIAVLCRPGSVDDLVQSIRFVVEKPAWRSLLGHNARREALEKYTWKEHVRRILNKLHNVHEGAACVGGI
jgi:glycosyltransferase involved in cell wall biosynthesis